MTRLDVARHRLMMAVEGDASVEELCAASMEYCAALQEAWALEAALDQSWNDYQEGEE